MANALLQDLSAATTLAGTDLFYVKQSGARGVKATGTQLLALVGTAYVPLAGGTMTGALTLPAGAVGAPSLMFAGAGATTGLYSTGSTNVSVAVGGVQQQYWTANSCWIASTASVGLLTDTAYFTIGSSLTTAPALYRDVETNFTFAFRNGTNTQNVRVYNTYTNSSNYERLALTGVAGSSVNITAESLGTGASNLDVVITPKGSGGIKFPGATVIASNGEITCPTLYAQTSAGFGLSSFIGRSTYRFGWTDSSSVSGTVDTAFFRNAAGIVEVTNGTANAYRDLKARNLLNVEYHQMTEMTAPSAPATNSVRIYAEDNGSGKTRLMALFATGAAQQLAIEP